MFAKTNIILKQDFHFELTGLDKALFDVYITIILHHRITPLQNIALEATTDPSLIESASNFISDVFTKIFTQEGIQADKKTVTLAIKSALMAFFFALKIKPSDTTENYLTLTFAVFFSVLGLPAKPYINRVMELKNMFDEDCIIEQIYSLQDYDYEMRV